MSNPMKKYRTKKKKLMFEKGYMIKPSAQVEKKNNLERWVTHTSGDWWPCEKDNDDAEGGGH